MAYLLPRQAAGTIPPPPGVTANFENPDFVGGPLVVVSAVFLALSLIAFGIRIYTRVVLVRAFGADDRTPVLPVARPGLTTTVSLLAAMVLTIVESALLILQTKNGLGNHLWDVPFKTFSPHFLLINWVSSINYSLAICLLKLSVLQLYLRLSPAKLFRLCNYVMIFVIVGFCFSQVMALLVGCRPLKSTWDLTVTGHCYNRAKQSVAGGYFNIFADAILLFLPMPMVWQLQLPAKQKLAVTTVFMAGSLSVAAPLPPLCDG